MSQIRLGILGAAGICAKNIRALASADGIEVVAIGSRSLQKAEALVSSLSSFLSPSAKAYGSYQEVLDLADLHAVYIPLPSMMHVEWVRKAACKGLHILLEKPVAANSSDLEQIMKTCDENGVQLMDGTMWMHNARTRHMEDIIRDTANFGPVANVMSNFTFCSDEEFNDNNIRVKADADPLGCLGDLGWYSIRAALWAYNFEMPEYVAAHPGAVFNEEMVPMRLGATLIWPGMPRRSATITCSFDQALTQTLEIASSSCSIHLRDFVIPYEENRSTFIATSKHGLGAYHAFDSTSKEEHVVMLQKTQETCMWEEFARCVRNIRDDGHKPDMKWAKIAWMTQQVVLAVAASARQQWVAIKVVDLMPMVEAPHAG